MNKNFTLLILLSTLIIMTLCQPASSEDGYKLWLRYNLIDNSEKLAEYRNTIDYLVVHSGSPQITTAVEELVTGLEGLIGKKVNVSKSIHANGAIVLITPNDSLSITSFNIKDKLKAIGVEGYLILSAKIDNRNCTVIAANEEIGILYGVFRFLRLMQTLTPISNLDISDAPKTKYRLLNHWDNLDRTVERGYAGFSLWDWHKLPDYLSPRYKDYARANASIGINGTVLTNVNANAIILTPQYLAKVAALANVFRPYGIKVYLTARFSAPIEIGELKTADPLDLEVKQWWKDKVEEIYYYIPDFGGFLVKANSEGQPGPQNYNRSHADGANLLADALASQGGIVIWRAFVYNYQANEDRAKQAYNEFVPLDGTFRDNVLVQAKNGAIDFQPREPFHPLFGAMPETPLMMEFQITQEYLGFATHLVFLAPLYKECLYSDTYAQGKGSYVAKIIDGSLNEHKETGFSGVSNIGTDCNWTGHHFGQANWFAFGRLAWDHTLSASEIAEEWIRMTFSNDQDVIVTLKDMMLASREIAVNYMTPLGLHHLMGRNHHYGPEPWNNEGRPDWTSLYYHRADSFGIGFDRTASGSDAISQYFPPVRDIFSKPETCPEEYLLWFHHPGWDYRMKSGRTLWEEFCYKYYSGADSVKWMSKKWASLESKIDSERFRQVASFLKIQEKEAVWWRNACVLYFQTFSNRLIPDGLEKPAKTLDEYKKMKFPYAPGIKPSW